MRFSKSWKPFPRDTLEKALDELPTKLFETGREDRAERTERLAAYPDREDDEEDED